MGIVWHSKDRDLREPAAVIAFAGWGDAGRAATGAARHLLETYPSRLVAEIPPDEFFDFTVRRPFTYLDGDERKIRWPENHIHLVHHPGRDLVVFVGEEPHLRWQLFTEDRHRNLGQARSTEGDLCLGAFLGEVPHTRPTPIFGAGNPRLIQEHHLNSTNYQGPTGIVGVLTSALPGIGIPAAALWGAVPHYLDDPDYPAGSYALLNKPAELLGINISAGDIAARSLEFRIAIDAELKEQPDLLATSTNSKPPFPRRSSARAASSTRSRRFLQDGG